MTLKQPKATCGNDGAREQCSTSFWIILIRTCPDPPPQVRQFSLPGGHPPGLPTWVFLALASGSLGQSGISGGFTDTGVCDRLNLSRLGLGDTLNLTSLQPLGGDTLGIDVSVRLRVSPRVRLIRNYPCLLPDRVAARSLTFAARNEPPSTCIVHPDTSLASGWIDASAHRLLTSNGKCKGLVLAPRHGGEDK